MLAILTLIHYSGSPAQGPQVSQRHNLQASALRPASAITTRSDAYTAVCRSLCSDWSIDPVTPYLNQLNVHQLLLNY